MKISRTFLIGIGGLGGSGYKPPIPAHFLALGNELISRGHRVVYLTWPRSQESALTNSLIYHFPSPRPTRLTDLCFAIKCTSQEKPDAILANFGSVNVLMLAGWIKRVPVRIAWYHTLEAPIRLDAKRPIWQLSLLEKRKGLFYRLCTHFVSVSTAGVNDLHTIFHVPLSRIKVLKNSLADPQLETLGLRDQQTLVCVGRFDICKGQDVLIHAIRCVIEEFPDIQIKFIGDGNTLANCKQLAQQLGVADKCLFLGKLPHQEVLRQLSMATVSVVPSRSDNLPTTVLESLAVGTPVIGTRVGGIPEMIRDGKDGFLVPTEDAEALASCIRMVLGNPALHKDLCENARQWFLDTFETSRVIPAHADWLESLLS